MPNGCRGMAPPGRAESGFEGTEQAVLTVLPERADLGESGRAERTEVSGQPAALTAMVGSHLPSVLTFGVEIGKDGIRGHRRPPLWPVLPAPVAAAVSINHAAPLRLHQTAVKQRETRLVNHEVIAV